MSEHRCHYVTLGVGRSWSCGMPGHVSQYRRRETGYKCTKCGHVVSMRPHRQLEAP